MEAQEKIAIVRFYPRFVSILEHVSDKFADFFFSKLLLYKPFHDIVVDISDDSITIVSNGESLEYVPWHVEQTMDVENSDRNSESENDNNVVGHGNITKHEWEII